MTMLRGRKLYFSAELLNYKEQQNKRWKQFVPVASLRELPQTRATILPALAKELVSF
jgi:hypothetical protein